MVSTFNSDNENWTEINSLIEAIDSAANLTAHEQARLVQINAETNWGHRDINDFCRLLHATMIRRTGTTD